MKTELFLFLSFVASASICHAQSTDALQYYVAYDVSGSIGHMDAKHQNLQHILFKLLHYEADTSAAAYHPALKIQLYAFGEDQSTSKARFQYPVDSSAVGLMDVVSYNTSQKYSHLHTALEAILDALKARGDTGRRATAGVFIFTDGLLQEGDIHDADVANYRTKIDSLLHQIKIRVGTHCVFIVQTSAGGPTFQFVEPRDTIALDFQQDSLGYSASYLWVHPEINTSTAPYNRSVDRFIHRANIAIIRPDKFPVTDAVDAAIVAAESLSSFRVAEDAAKDTTIKLPETPGELGNLKALLANDSLSVTQISALKAMLHNLASPPATTAKDQIDLPVSADSLMAYKAEVINAISAPENASSLTSLPISLAPAYTGVTPASVSEVAQQVKSWENFEQDLILGLTDYIIKRTKQEGVYVFLDHLHHQVFIKSDEMKLLFPTVFTLSSGLDNEQPDVMRLKDAVKKDIRDLPDALFRYPQFAKSESTMALWLFLVLYDGLQANGSLEQSFAGVVARVEKEPDLNSRLQASKAGKSLLAGIRLIKYLAQHDFAEVYHAYDDPDALDDLSTLLFVLAIDTTGISEVINMPAVRRQIRNVYEQYRRTRQQLDRLKALLQQEPTADFNGYRAYQQDLLLDILKQVTSLMTSGMEVARYIRYDSDTLSNGKAHPINLPDEIAVRRMINSVNRGIDAWFAIRSENYVQGMFDLAEGLMEVNSELSDNKYLRSLLLASGEVASARSAEEISDIIAKHTLPVASYRAKRRDTFTCMITAYAGVSGATFFDQSFSTPILAAIGPELTIGFGKQSVSVMGTVLDVGNIVSYRFGNRSEISEEQEVSFARILSPGVLVSFGLSRKLPLAITASWMGNPGRAQLGLAMDLPLIRFSRK